MTTTRSQGAAAAGTQGQDLALHGPHRRPRAGRNPAGRRRTRHRWRATRAAARMLGSRQPSRTPATRSGPPISSRRPRRPRHLGSRALGGGAQRARPGPAGRRRPRAGRERRAAQRGVRPGSSSRAWRGAATLASRPSSRISSMAAAKLGGLVASRGDVKRAQRQEPDVGARWPRPARAANAGQAACEGSAKPQQRLLAPGRLAHGRQHPGGDARGARRRRRSRSSTRTRSPRWAARQAQARPIAPAPTTIASTCLMARLGTLLLLPGSGPGHHPCAGITRVRFRRSAAAMPPSQPTVGLPLRL